MPTNEPIIELRVPWRGRRAPGNPAATQRRNTTLAPPTVAPTAAQVHLHVYYESFADGPKKNEFPEVVVPGQTMDFDNCGGLLRQDHCILSAFWWLHAVA